MIRSLYLKFLLWNLNRLVRKAQKKLARDVERRKQSFEVEQFRRRRAAMLKFTRKEVAR